MAAVAAGAIGFGRWLDGAWQGTPYPVADPAATARRLDGHTQALYDALGLPRAGLAEDWPGDGMHAGLSSCPRRGLRHFPEGLSDSPPSEPGVTTVSEDWALKGVSPAQAGPALERARERMTQRGWKVTDYEHSGPRLWLRLTHPGTGDSLSAEAYPGDRLGVAAYADCARYPSDTPMDLYDKPRLPARQAPAPLRQAAVPGNERR
ncbi:hypothetical protein GCM10010324_30550 [Streptomyces hiroshimensis]|uniref:Uncharacterized protein n=2 Tax=Streptomyces hiroshimensis TaxID=66424 RepID=A0ABQ2YGD9_9ACTN|nr:hypothetical protein GCM10010324_30550 [Streptomyces hiroshimensis]